MLTFDKQCLITTSVSTLLIRKHSLRLLALSSLAKNHQTNARHPLWQSHRSDYQWTEVQSKAWILNLCEWNSVNEIDAPDCTWSPTEFTPRKPREVSFTNGWDLWMRLIEGCHSLWFTTSQCEFKLQAVFWTFKSWRKLRVANSLAKMHCNHFKRLTKLPTQWHMHCISRRFSKEIFSSRSLWLFLRFELSCLSSFSIRLNKSNRGRFDALFSETDIV